MINKYKPKKNGFTMVEMIVVIALIGIISAIGVPIYNGYIEKTKRNAIFSVSQNLRNMIQGTITKCAGNETKWITMEDGQRIYCGWSNHHANVSAIMRVFRDQFKEKNPYNKSYMMVNVSGSNCDPRYRPINMDYTRNPTQIAMCHQTDQGREVFAFRFEHWPNQ